MKTASLGAIEIYLPERVVSNEELVARFPDWTADKVAAKTGISKRHIAAASQYSSDMAVAAAQKLFNSGAIQRHEIDYLLLCTQSPDYILPTTACLVQERLGLPKQVGAFDINLGCSGFIYGLGIAKGLIETGQAKNVLLLTAETYSKFIHPLDRSVATIFGDGAAATLIQGVENGGVEKVGPFVYGTDGSGAKNLIVPTGGMRSAVKLNAPEEVDESGNHRTVNNLYMNGLEIFNFTLRVVPQTAQGLLDAAGRSVEQVDWFVFHQANLFMLEHLRKKMRIPAAKFPIIMSEVGNTVSSTIPIALRQLMLEDRIHSGDVLMLLGFGVGYSWAGVMLEWA